MKQGLLFLVIIFFWFLPPAQAEIKTFVHTVRQPFSGSQSPDDALIAGTQRAKREVLEKAGTYLESVTTVEDGNLRKDQVLALASGVLKTEIISQKRYHTEKGFGIIIKVRVAVDTSVLEDRITKLLKDRTLLKKYEESQQRVKELLAKVRILEEQNNKPLSEISKVQLKKEFRETSQKLTAADLNQRALALWNHGFYTDVAKAIGYLEQAILLDQSYASAYSNLGLAYESKGDYDKAIEYFQKSLKINLKKLGLEHQDVARDYNNLGVAYQSKGDYDEAIEYFYKSLKIYLKKLGSEDPDVALNYNNLGLTYSMKGDYDKAIEYFQKSLKINLKKLGSEDPNVAINYNNLGFACDGKGDHDEAIEYYKKSLEINLAKLGSEHPNVARDYNNLGDSYRIKGDYDEAIEDFQKSLKINLKKLGPEHPDVAVMYSNLGMVYIEKGDYDKAFEYAQKALNIARGSLGSNHPHTKIIQENVNYAKGAHLSKFYEGIDTREQ